jgi:hypothetical protein
VNIQLQWPSIFEDYRKGSGQTLLPFCPASIDNNTYLARHCGTCNRLCNVQLADCSSLDALTPFSNYLNAVLTDVGGLGFDIAGPTTNTSRLPSRVPLIWDCRNAVPSAEPIYAISLETLFRPKRKNGVVRVYPNRDIRRCLGLPAETRLFLTGSSQDDLLVWIWDHKGIATETMSANCFEYIATPNFSAYGTKCPVEWSYNQKRSLVFLDYIRDITPNPIATLTLQSEVLFNRVVDWLKANPQVSSIAVNFQMMKDDREFKLAVHNVQSLQQLVGRTLHVIVTGPTTESKINYIVNTLGSATVISSFYYNRDRTISKTTKGGDMAYGKKSAYWRRPASRSRKRSFAGT